MDFSDFESFTRQFTTDAVNLAKDISANQRPRPVPRRPDRPSARPSMDYRKPSSLILPLLVGCNTSIEYQKNERPGKSLWMTTLASMEPLRRLRPTSPGALVRVNVIPTAYSKTSKPWYHGVILTRPFLNRQQLLSSPKSYVTLPNQPRVKIV